MQFKVIKSPVIATILLLLCGRFLFADGGMQGPSENNFEMPDSVNIEQSPAADTVKTDSINANGPELPEMAKADTSLPLYSPLLTHGSVYSLGNNLPFRKIKKEDYQLWHYGGLSDIIYKRAPAYPMHLGNYGHFNQFSFFGGSARDNAILFNNRPLNDFEYGSFNIDQYSPEFLENIEILAGSEALILFGLLSAINLQEISHNTKKPYTRMFFSEAGYNHLTADGIFSQNFARNWNYTFGFKKITSDGRYENSYTDSWHVRNLARLNFSERASASFVWNYFYSELGANGGIDYSKALDNFLSLTVSGTFEPADDRFAEPVYANLIEKNFRHDLNASFTAILDSDSTHAFSGIAYFTHSDWGRSSSSGNFTPEIEGSEGLYTSYISKRFGLRGDYELEMKNGIGLKLGGSADVIDLEGSKYIEAFEGPVLQGFGLLRLKLFNAVNMSAGLNLKQRKDDISFTFGGKFELSPFKWMKLMADISRSERLPSPSEGLGLSRESNFLSIAEMRIGFERFGLNLTAFALASDSPIIHEPLFNDDSLIIGINSFNADKSETFGAALRMHLAPLDTINFSGWRFLPANLSIWGQAWNNTRNGVNYELFPQLLAGFEFFSQFIIGQSISRVGFDFNIISDFKGLRFNPLTRSYIPGLYNSGLMSNGLNLFARARLGNAFLRIRLENLMSLADLSIAESYYSAIYPKYDFNFQLQVSWHFFN